jgi:hypothetical protein
MNSSVRDFTSTEAAVRILRDRVHRKSQTAAFGRLFSFPVLLHDLVV